MLLVLSPLVLRVEKFNSSCGSSQRLGTLFGLRDRIPEGVLDHMALER